MINMNPATALEAVNAAADKDFKWWFLALLVILLCSGLKVVHYLVKRNEEQSKQMHESYRSNTEAQIEVAKHLAVCSQTLMASTQALERSSDLVELTSDVIRETREELKHRRNHT